MLKLMKMMLGITGLFILSIGGIFLLFYFFQEKVIFEPEKLPANYQFEYEQNFQERYMKMADGKLLHGLLFRCKQPQGLVFYLHGNAGSLDQWGYVAPPFLKANYDVFIIDYRGFGKSEGKISSESQMHQDMQRVYDQLKINYSEEQIVLVGFSLGTGLATKLASSNNPRLLILKAPYFSMLKVKDVHFPYVPSFLVRYPLYTYKYIDRINCPLVIFHGDADEIVPYESSLKLKERSKVKTDLYLLEGQMHNGISFNPEYLEKINEILNQSPKK